MNEFGTSENRTKTIFFMLQCEKCIWQNIRLLGQLVISVLFSSIRVISSENENSTMNYKRQGKKGESKQNNVQTSDSSEVHLDQRHITLSDLIFANWTLTRKVFHESSGKVYNRRTPVGNKEMRSAVALYVEATALRNEIWRRNT